MKISLFVLSTLSLSAATGCLGDVGPATFQLASIEYTPDDTNADKTETFFSYNDEGQLTSVETEVDGDETEEWSYTYADGVLTQYETESKGGLLEFTLTTEVTFSGGVMTSETATVSGDGSYTDQGLDVDYTTDGDGSVKLTFDDAGLVTKREEVFDFKITQVVNTAGGEIELVDTQDSETVSSYTWNDEGLLTATDVEAEQTSESRQDGQETGSQDVVQETEDTYSYAEGVFSELEREIVTQVGTADTRTEQTLSADFNEDGQLTQAEGTSETDNVETDVELEIEYDDEGRMTRIEDQDGNRWDLTYAGTDPVSGGLTLGLEVLPDFIDLSGKQVMGSVGAISHQQF